VLPGSSDLPIFVWDKFLQELRMLKKAAALLFVCASMATWVGCGSTSSRYLYAAIPASNEIVMYREDPNTGVLTQLTGSPVSAGSAVQSLVMHPSGKFLYAANSGDGPPGDISLFTVSTTGVITEVTPRTNVGSTPTVLAMDSAGSFLYVGNAGSGSISAFSIDSGTGALTEVAGSPFQIGLPALSMKVAPSGSVLYVTIGGNPGVIEAFNLTQGVLSASVPGSPFLTGKSPYGLVIAESGGFLYTANTLDNSISKFTIGTDGSLTELSEIGEQYSAPVALFIDKSGAFMYVANQGSSNLAAYSIGSDGSLSLLTNSPFGTGAGPNSLVSDSSGKHLFVGSQQASGVQSFSLDASNGTLTSVATYSGGSTTSSIAVTP
jgi:6-phosphogluconolactonase (cycloisomerase 2 family)